MAKNIVKGSPWWDGYHAKCEDCGTSFDVERSDISIAHDLNMASGLDVRCPECGRRLRIFKPLANKTDRRSPFADFPIPKKMKITDPARRW